MRMRPACVAVVQSAGAVPLAGWHDHTHAYLRGIPQLHVSRGRPAGGPGGARPAAAAPGRPGGGRERALCKTNMYMYMYVRTYTYTYMRIQLATAS